MTLEAELLQECRLENLKLHKDRIRHLEHELALARASSDYWRAKYIAARKFNTSPKLEMDYTGGRIWFRRLMENYDE